MRPAKSQISLRIRAVWSESSLCAQWEAKDPRFLHADSEDSDQTGRMPRLIWVFAGRTGHFDGYQRSTSQEKMKVRILEIAHLNCMFYPDPHERRSCMLLTRFISARCRIPCSRRWYLSFHQDRAPCTSYLLVLEQEQNRCADMLLLVDTSPERLTMYHLWYDFLLFLWSSIKIKTDTNKYLQIENDQGGGTKIRTITSRFWLFWNIVRFLAPPVFQIQNSPSLHWI